MMRFLFFCLLAMSLTAHAATQENYPFISVDEANRFHSLTKEIRCVVCQNQSIAESNAPLANDLRNKIYRMILEKKSDAAIKQYLVKRYGEFILLQPRVNKLTLFLWLFPGIGLLGAVVFLFRYARRNN